MTEKSDPDLKKEFEEEINKPYYKVDYLDNFKLPFERTDVTAIIPTFNRCPYSVKSLRGERNPLSWAIQSLLLQKPVMKEIIIVDDQSEDFTKEVVESFEEEAEKLGIKLIYLKTPKRSGWPVSRNLGSSKANSKYLFFVDDDSIMAPYSVFGAVFTYEWLKNKGINIGLLNLPPYARTSIPNKVVSKKDIGYIDFSRGEYTSNKNAFPLEYINGKGSEDKFIHQEYHILDPIPIKNNGGYVICEKDVFVKVGGFPESILKRFVDREFGCKMMENGYAIYLQPDPKFHCVHGSYGLKTDKEFEGDDWFRKLGGISLKRAMIECNKPSGKTGNRIDINEFYYQIILSVFYMLYSRNKEGAKKWIEKVYQKFVVEGDLSLFDTASKEIPNDKERESMWNKAVRNGLNFIIESERKELRKINKTIKKIKERGEKSQEIAKIMEEL